MIESKNTTIMTEGRKSLNIKTETWERLQKFGIFRESTDELLNRLMDNYVVGREKKEKEGQKK